MLTDDDFESLVRNAAEAWRGYANRRGGRFDRFVPADYYDVRAGLLESRATASSFLELGSGIGAITILADMLGFEAFGIEIESELVAESQRLAESCGSSAAFVEGNFVPRGYESSTHQVGAESLVSVGDDAYAELGLSIGDFDLVYAYPWPGEEEWLVELVRDHAGPDTTLLHYSASDGLVRTVFR